jgi:hypothetical protein
MLANSPEVRRNSGSVCCLGTTSGSAAADGDYRTKAGEEPQRILIRELDQKSIFPGQELSDANWLFIRLCWQLQARAKAVISAVSERDIAAVLSGYRASNAETEPNAASV